MRERSVEFCPVHRSSPSLLRGGSRVNSRDDPNLLRNGWTPLMKFQVGPRSDEAGRWTRLARLSRSTCRSSYPVCVSSFFHASNFARLFFLPRISLHRFSSISPLDIYLHFDHLTLQEDVPIATNPRNLFDSKRKKKRRDEKSGARTRRTNYELSYVSNNLLSRAFTVTLINSKKRLLISIYIYT